jgi:EAL domain-containing protein (putative c-di-GMP-specific phosphodiesterase class I)
VGIARARHEQTHPQELIREADLAMYQAKRRGGGIESYAETGELELEARLREAVQRAGLAVHYQPVIALADGTLHSLEALVRWEHPERGLQEPAEILPVAEDTGLIVEIDMWVISEACRTLGRWRSAALLDDQVPVSVNLSSRTLRSSELAGAVEAATRAAAIPTDRLSLELTEAGLELDRRGAATALEALVQLGARLCLDDFGSGRASLRVLSSHPWSAVKLDRATIAAASVDAQAARMLAALLAGLHAADLRTIAKGIETAPQRDAMRRLGCDAAQGFLFAAPAPAEEIEQWLATQSTR